MPDHGFEPRVYLDTNVFIRAFESRPEEAEYLQTAFVFLQQNRNLAVTSELTLAEVLAPPRNQAGRAPTDPNKRLFYMNLIVWNGFIDLRPVTRKILISTADWRGHTRAKLPDAIHIVTAIGARCAYFMSSDHEMKLLPQPMWHFFPDPSGIHALIGALRG